MKPYTAGVALVFALTSPVVAGDDTKLDCENAMSTHDLNACAGREFETADAAMNEAYKKALAAIPSMASDPPYDAKSWEAALRASQRAWVAFRDAECQGHVAMFWTGGTGATADIIGCETEMTKARTEALKARYEDGEAAPAEKK
ncbi:MAG: lysozyme inhibitor LprI family protein [Hyphomicrobium sp.]